MRFSLENAIRLSRLRSVTCQSRVVPQKPSSESPRLNEVPASLVFSGSTLRPSYMAKKNSRSFTIGPEAHTLRRVESVLSLLRVR